MNDQFNSEHKYAAGDDMDRLSRFTPHKQHPFRTFLLLIFILGIAFFFRSEILYKFGFISSPMKASLEICDVSATSIDDMGNIHIEGSVKALNFIAKDVFVSLQLESSGETVFEGSTVIPLILIGQSEKFSFHLNLHEDLAYVSNHSVLTYSIFAEGKPFCR